MGVTRTVIPGDWIRLEQIINELFKRTLPTMNTTGTFYFQAPDLNGNYTSGDVRLTKVAANSIEMQVFDGTNWLSGDDALASWTY